MKNINDNDVANPTRILDVAYSFWKAKALLSGVELDLFTVLAAGPLDFQTLAARLGLHTRSARDFFDALVALDFLQRDADGRYSNRPDSDVYLDRQKPAYLGDLLRHLNARHYANWSLLTRALRSGTPQSGALATGGYSTLYADTREREVFLRGMTAGSLLAAQRLATTFAWGDYTSVLDIGT